MQYSIIQKSQLEGALRLDKELLEEAKRKVENLINN